ncbi:MAG: AAA family ATPase [SAR324 cluster bacterium]|nr:AAA family ATPase [SAR324 cluster bacterium]
MLKPGVRNIAYGASDFERIRTENRYYVDKTRFIPMLEENYYQFLIRPRRFGKSLWVSILETYYDITKKDRFENFFKGLWIGDHPTEERNSYLVLALNFSGVSSDIREVRTSFEAYCHIRIRGFLYRYRQFFTEQEIQKWNNPALPVATLLSDLFETCLQRELPLYLLIDEYDNFANTILSTAGTEAYHDLTHGEGFFRNFFTVLKEGTSHSGSGLKRLFITGVSPVTMDDVTSGFNIGSNLSLSPSLNAMVGFTREEVLEMLDYYQREGAFVQDRDETMDIFDEWYDGYQFAPGQRDSLYNTDMVVYYMRDCIQTGQPPYELLDQNIRIDYGKLRHLLLVSRQLNGNFDLLKNIMDTGQALSPIHTSFPLEHLTIPDNFMSLLYFFGLLTIEAEEMGDFHLKIPNRTIGLLMYEYLREAWRDVGTFRVELWKLRSLVRDMAWKGDWEPFFDFLAGAVAAQTSIRDYMKGEKVIQGFLLAYLHLNDFLLSHSERELGKGYADLFLEPFLLKYPEMSWGYLIELKYIKRDELTDTRLEQEITKAQTQLRQYLADDRLKQYPAHVTFTGIILVYHGWELVYRGAVQSMSST